MAKANEYNTIYNTPIRPNWCAGCGNYGIWSCLKQSLVELGLEPHEVVLTFDIGCNGNMADKINTYGFKSLHGRTIPVATGIKIANPTLKVIAIGGDAGILEEGIEHLIWAARSNYDITVLMHNNQRLALTTGQPTTTTKKGEPSKTAPHGIVEDSINPLHVALTASASFVARGFAGDPKQLTQLIKKAINHKGFAFLDILQPCVNFNKINTFEWFRERIYKVDQRDDYDRSNWDQAFEMAKLNDKIATGIIYKAKHSVPYLSRIPYRSKAKTTLINEVKKYSIKGFIEEFE